MNIEKAVKVATVVLGNSRDEETTDSIARRALDAAYPIIRAEVIAEVVEALRAPVIGAPDHPDAIWDVGRRRAADFIERRFK